MLLKQKSFLHNKFPTSSDSNTWHSTTNDKSTTLCRQVTYGRAKLPSVQLLHMPPCTYK